MGYEIEVIGTDQDNNEFIQESILVPYHYNKFYNDIVCQSLKTILDGKKCTNTITVLKKIVSRLGTDRTIDMWWNKTPGNAGYYASILLKYAKDHPKANWSVK